MVEQPLVYDVGLRTRFRGITRRSGMLIRGRAGWAEWSPFPEYTFPETESWWAATIEAAELGFPEPRRTLVPVNSIVPAVGPERAGPLALAGGCTTAKVKVGERGQDFAEDLDRVAAVRAALGPGGRVRVDANGAWGVEEALDRLARLHAYDLEYAEQPCAGVAELAELRVRLARAGVDVPIAADESIRRSGDPQAVVAQHAADIAVLKVQPLGGVRACLELADQLGLPVVVSSALETSVGIRAGVALAAALPELPFACGLNTVPLLHDDVVRSPLVAHDGVIEVRDVEVIVRDQWQPSVETRQWWLERWQGLEADMRGPW